MEGEPLSRAAKLEAILRAAEELTAGEPAELSRNGQLHERLQLERCYALIWTIGCRVNRAIGAGGKPVRGREKQLKGAILPTGER